MVSKKSCVKDSDQEALGSLSESLSKTPQRALVNLENFPSLMVVLCSNSLVVNKSTVSTTGHPQNIQKHRKINVRISIS